LTVVERNQKAPLSIAAAEKGKGGDLFFLTAYRAGPLKAAST